MKSTHESLLEHGNLFVSRSAEEDALAESLGYKFLGGARPRYIGEIHVFEIMPLEEFNEKS